jgi:molybdenum cofactor cytidylyltransferase
MCARLGLIQARFARVKERIMHSQPVVVVLAAGRSSRFDGGSNKLAQNLGPLSVLGMTLSHALATELPVVLVTTAALATEAQRVLAARDVLVLPDVQAFAGGVGYSMAVGVGARPNARGWVMLPGDMPMVQPSTIRAVAQELTRYAVTYPQHSGRAGRPLGFAAELYSELVSLSGDDGARRLGARYPSHGVDVLDPGVLMDVDTPDDLMAVRQTLQMSASLTLPRSPDTGPH